MKKSFWQRLFGRRRATVAKRKHWVREFPYAIGSNYLPGLSKVIEEAGEVDQVIGKIIGIGHMGTHWGLEPHETLKEQLEDEIADLGAAIMFAIVHLDLDALKIIQRRSEKYEKFNMWHDRVQKGLDPVTGEPE